MDPITSKKIIDVAGGDTAFARMMGLPIQPGIVQRVCNWKRRGIPRIIELEHAPLIRRLQALAERTS